VAQKESIFELLWRCSGYRLYGCFRGEVFRTGETSDAPQAKAIALIFFCFAVLPDGLSQASAGCRACARLPLRVVLSANWENRQ
jgi:hypothetical protein